MRNKKSVKCSVTLRIKIGSLAVELDMGRPSVAALMGRARKFGALRF